MKAEGEIVGKKREKQRGQERVMGGNMINLHKENGPLGIFMEAGRLRNLNRVEVMSHQCPFLPDHTSLS